MKVCIVGAGAIGGFIGTRLAVAGRAEVSAVARGATLAALRTHGWRLRTANGLLQAPARAEAAPAALGAQDLVVIAVKGPALTEVAQELAEALLHLVVEFIADADGGCGLLGARDLDGGGEDLEEVASADAGGLSGGVLVGARGARENASLSAHILHSPTAQQTARHLSPGSSSPSPGGEHTEL